MSLEREVPKSYLPTLFWGEAMSLIGYGCCNEGQEGAPSKEVQLPAQIFHLFIMTLNELQSKSTRKSPWIRATSWPDRTWKGHLLSESSQHHDLISLIKFSKWLISTFTQTDLMSPYTAQEMTAYVLTLHCTVPLQLQSIAHNNIKEHLPLPV